jgi:hypothetical protein
LPNEEYHPIIASVEAPEKDFFTLFPINVRDWSSRKLGLDRAIIFTTVARVWSSAAGLVTIALIARSLSAAQQGYYYTFGSLVALQMLFELGFSLVIQQLAAHERAHLIITANDEIAGDRNALSRLASIFKLSIRWYAVVAAVLSLVLTPAGLYFFTAHAPTTVIVAWQAPWILAALAAALNLQLSPILSFMEGCGYVADVAALRFFQALAGSLLAWGVLAAHSGLYAPAMQMLGSAGATMFWVACRRKLLFSLYKHEAGDLNIRWQTEVWPFQWRIAISFLCGYFIFQLFNPVIFAFKGPIAAGQMGMSLSMATSLQFVAYSWINTKAAPFGIMVARKEYAKLDAVFFRAATQAFAVCAVGAVSLWAVVYWMNVVQFPFAKRMLMPLPFGLLLAATTVNLVVFCEAVYLRAHKQEKFLLNSILNGVLIGSCTFFLGKYRDVLSIVFAYLCISVCVGFGYGTFTFVKYRRLWHA